MKSISQPNPAHPQARNIAAEGVAHLAAEHPEGVIGQGITCALCELALERAEMIIGRAPMGGDRGPLVV